MHLKLATGLLLGEGWELESLSGSNSGPEGPQEGAAENIEGGEALWQGGGAGFQSRWGLLIFNDSLLEPEFQGSCGVGSMWKLELLDH